jgi:hypothetical protein
MAHEIIEGLDAGHGHSAGGSGKLFPDATLVGPDGASVSFDSYRGRWDLVVLMLGAESPERPAQQLLNALADARADVEAEEGRIVAVTATDPARLREAWAWPFPLLFDAGAALHHRVGAVDGGGRPATALYITDRYREIFTVLRPGDTGWPASGRSVVEWLQFINVQCPECNPPEE